MAIENNATPAGNAGVSQQEEYTDFSEVFDSLMDKGTGDEEDTSSDQATGAAGAAGDDGQQAQSSDGAGDSGQPPAAGDNPPPADGAGSQDDQGGEPAGGDQGAQNVDWQAQFQALQAQFDAFKAGTQQTYQQPPAADQSGGGAAAPEIYSADEKAELAELQKEWPDLHRLFTLMSRQVQVDTLNYAFSEVGKVLQPLQESVSTYSTNDHLSAIYDAHEDYDQVYQPTMEWIEKQPSFLKAAYQNVVKQGTAEEVSLMIQRFKDETGWKAPAASGNGPAPTTPKAAASTPSQQQTGLSEAAKKAAKAMGAVGTKRGGQAAAQDPNDFDGAWDEATAA